MTRLQESLGIQAGEGRSASLMLAHSFLMGLSTVFFETAASALFLASFGASWLPWVYVAAAVLNIGTGVAYTSIRQNVSFRTLMGGTLVFLLLSVAGFRGALAFTSEAWLAFTLLVFYRVLSILTDLEYWAVAARLYNVRQAKRLFGFIGSGEVVARIVGAFAVPGLMKVFGGVDDLVTLSAVALAGCLVVVLPVLRVISVEQEESSRSTIVRPEPKRSAWQHLRVLLDSRYLTLILSLAALGVLGKYFVDFAFLEQMKARFGGGGNVKELAGFFGIFSGVSQAVSLLTRVLLSGRILNRYGIGTGLLILPVAHTLCTALIVVFGTAAAAPVVFWLAVMNQGIYKTLKHPIDNPSFKVLYQPLKREQRLSAQIAVEAIVTPVAIGIAGGLMLLFTSVITFNPATFAWIMLATFVGWMVVARLASAEYRGALMRALRSRLVDHEALSLSDQPSIQLVRDKLNSSSPGDVIFALDLLERFDQKDVGTLLAARLMHPSPDVRRYVLQRLEILRPPRALEAVRTSVLLERDPGVKAAALRCLAALGDDAVDGQVAAFLQSPDLDLRRGAIAGLLRDDKGTALAAAKESLRALALSTQPADREAAARVVGEVGGGAHEDVLLPLLRDEDPDVRRAALAAAARVTSVAAWNAVVDSLTTPTYCTAAAASLVATGHDVLAVIGERLPREKNRLARYRLAWASGRIGGPAAIPPLVNQVGDDATVVRLQVLESLSRAGWKATGEDAERIRGILREEAVQTAWRAACLVALTGDDKLKPLRAALDSEQEEARRRTLALVACIADRDTILRAAENIGHEHKDRRAYAMELLDLAVPRDLRDLVLPVVEDLPPETRIERLEELAPGPGLDRPEVLRQIIVHPAHWLRPWTRAVAMWSAGQLQLGVDAILPATTEHDRMVAETLHWARTGEREDGTMLTVEKVMILKGVQMFSRTPEEVLEDLAAILEEVDLKKDDFIFRKGDRGDSMYIIIDGSVRVMDGDRTINVLGDRDIFGELALLDPEPRSASIQAMEDTRLFRIDRETFSELMAGSISIVRGVLHILCERLRRLIPMARTAAAAEEAARAAAAERAASLMK